MHKRNKLKDIQMFFRRLFHRKVVIVGAVIVFAFIFAAIFADVIAPYSPYKIDILHSLRGSTADHWLGTDENGRDVFSRVLFGARTSLLIGLVAVLFSAAAGILLGLISGYFGGWVDIVFLVLWIPFSYSQRIVGLSTGLVMGNSIPSLMFILGISTVPNYARIMRGQVMSIRDSDYVMAESVIGASTARITLGHLFANCIAPMIVLITQKLATLFYPKLHCLLSVWVSILPRPLGAAWST